MFVHISDILTRLIQIHTSKISAVDAHHHGKQKQHPSSLMETRLPPYWFFRMITKDHRSQRLQYHSSSLGKKSLRYWFFVIVFCYTSLNLILSLVHQNVDNVATGRTSYERSLRQNTYGLPSVFLAQQIELTVITPGAVINSTTSMEMKCSKHHVWENDRMWREAVLMPEICTTEEVSTAAVEQYQQKQLSLLMETLFSNNTDFTPCGAYCVYHLDSAYSIQYGHPMYGWVLQLRQNNKKSVTSNVPVQRGCWLPFNSHNDNSKCVVHYYNDWIGYVEDVEAKQRQLPPYDHFSGSATGNQCNHTIIQQQMAPYQPKCANVNEPEDNFYTRSNAPFCHFRSYNGGNSISIRELQSLGSLEFSKNLKPSEILHLFGRHQLGIDDLSDALTLMNEAFIDLNASSCSAANVHLPQKLSLCVYHRESMPRISTLPGQYGSKVPIKGWQYRTLDNCFVPFENMEFSASCGRSSDQFMTWTRHMSERVQDHIDRRVDLVEEESTSKIMKCDRLPLSLGRNYWDTDTDELVNLPPVPTTNLPIDGVEYSEESICGPRILIVGALKCGTNTIGQLLSNHPRVKVNRCTDTKPNCDLQHFTADKGAIWENHGLSHGFVHDPIHYVGKYAKKLPITEEYNSWNGPNGTKVVGRGSITFDQSPSYLNTEIFPNIAKRTKELLPNAKIIVALCNPVERMHLEYSNEDSSYFGRKLGSFFTDFNVPVPSDFTEFVDVMKFSSDICYKEPIFCDELRRNKLRTGIYYEGLKNWRNAFGVENVLVLDLQESSESKMKKITSLMGDYLPENEYPWDSLKDVSHSGRSLSHLNHTIAFNWLRGFYYQHNVALAEEIDAAWPLLWNQIAT